MQKTVYTCDHCQETIGAKKHITLVVAANMIGSGIAIPPNTLAGTTVWSVHQKLNGKFMHFCNGSCIGKFFTGLMKKTEMLKKAK